MSLVDSQERKLIVHARPDYGAVGRATLGAGLALAVLGLPVLFLTLPEVWPLAVIPVVMIALGGFFAAADRTTVIDLDARTISGVEGVELDHVMAVVTTSQVETHSTSQFPNRREREFLVYELSLLLRDDPESAEVLAQLCHEREMVVREDREKAAYRQRAEGVVEHSLVRFAKALGGPDVKSVVLSRHGEKHVWQGAEKLARALGVPLIDFTSGELELRAPAELDLSLEKRMRLGLVVVDLTPRRPKSFQVEDEGKVWRVTWRRSPAALQQHLVLVGGSVAAALLFSLLTTWWVGGFLLILTAAFGKMIAGVDRTVGRHVLTLDERAIHLESGHLRRHQQSISRNELEVARVTHRLAGALSLVGDERHILLPLKRAHAEWLKLWLELALIGAREDEVRTGAEAKDPSLRQKKKKTWDEAMDSTESK